jgi:hypothetical protein
LRQNFHFSFLLIHSSILFRNVMQTFFPISGFISVQIW